MKFNAINFRIVSILLSCVLILSCGVCPRPQKVDDYLYSIEFEDYDFEKLSRFADKMLYGKKKLPRPACSAIYCDSLFGRNFDWMYDRMPEFVIYTAAGEGRYASLGMAAPITLLKDSQVNSLWGKFIMSKLPVFTVDGINEKGVACCINVAPQGDCGFTVGTNPGKPRLYEALLVRYILDHASSAKDAVELLDSRDIYTSVAFGLKEEYHLLIADSNSCFVVEFVDNRPVVLEGQKIITNFNIAAGVTAHAMGVERYDILKQGCRSAGTMDGMFELLKKVRFTGLYKDSDPLWLSELCSTLDGYGLTTADISTNPEKFEKPLELERELYLNRSRNDNWKKKVSWQSVHTSVYNLDARTLTVSTQESDRRHCFRLFCQAFH